MFEAMEKSAQSYYQQPAPEPTPEERIAALEAEQASIYEKLNSPAADGSTDFAALNKRLAEIVQESENLTWKWEEASTALEKLEQELQVRLEDLSRPANP